MTNELGIILFAGVALCIVAVALLNASVSKHESKIERLQYELKAMQYQIEALEDLTDRLVIDDSDDSEVEA